MTFDWLSRFRKPGTMRDARGQHHPQRPPPMITRLHGKRPTPTPQVRPQVRRGHQSMPVPVPRSAPARKGPVARPPAPLRKGPVARPPARPHPPQREPLQYLHFHFHPTQKRDLALPPPRPSKQMRSQQAPPFPPPRGVPKAPSRHVHWAPAQAPLPNKPYPYPSQVSSHAYSQARSLQYQSPPPGPRYQPPRSSHGSFQLPYRSR